MWARRPRCLTGPARRRAIPRYVTRYTLARRRPLAGGHAVNGQSGAGERRRCHAWSRAINTSSVDALGQRADISDLLADIGEPVTGISEPLADIDRMLDDISKSLIDINQDRADNTRGPLEVRQNAFFLREDGGFARQEER